ncbi:hypothetical protein BJX66DRAFT_119451 [Aspergillus keveii]|uniref:Uncharacterized protein n=1 Tax=Aspergillus keveii TaxID=714993 RepID=A0ABR4FKN6_9EURO
MLRTMDDYNADVNIRLDRAPSDRQTKLVAREPHLSCESFDSPAANASHTIWPKPPSEITGRFSSRHWNCGFASKIATWLFARTSPPSEVCRRKHKPPSSIATIATICRFLRTVRLASRILASRNSTTFEFGAESCGGAKYIICRMTQVASRRVLSSGAMPKFYCTPTVPPVPPRLASTDEHYAPDCPTSETFARRLAM